MGKQQAIREFDLLLYQARNENLKDFAFYIGTFIEYDEEEYKNIKVIINSNIPFGLICLSPLNN